METFSALLSLWGELTAHWWIPLTKISEVELWCFFYLSPNKQLRKPWRCQWFEIQLSSLWPHCNGFITILHCLLSHDMQHRIIVDCVIKKTECVKRSLMTKTTTIFLICNLRFEWKILSETQPRVPVSLTCRAWRQDNMDSTEQNCERK